MKPLRFIPPKSSIDYSSLNNGPIDTAASANNAIQTGPGFPSLDHSQLIKCQYCTKIFSKRMNYNRHKKSHERPYHCPLCYQTFGLQSDLDRHRTVHDKNMPKLPCNWDGCGRSYNRADHLLRHMKRAHSNKFQVTSNLPQEDIQAEVRKRFKLSTAKDKLYTHHREWQWKLLIASVAGDIAAVESLIPKRADNHPTDFEDPTLPSIPQDHGREVMAQPLPEEDACFHAELVSCDTALQAAATDGHEAVARLLLENGTDVNARNGTFGSALQAASYYGHEALVRLLLEKGTDVNARNGTFGSALQTASYHGHEATVRLLLDKGADANVKGGLYGCPLQTASCFGHEAVVRLLLEKGADVNLKSRPYGSALQAASVNGEETIVRLLLEKGADVNAKDGSSSTLQAARIYEYKKVGRLQRQLTR